MNKFPVQYLYSMQHVQIKKKNTSKISPVLRALFIIGLIIFLLYAALLIREFTGKALGQTQGLLWAIKDIFTFTNFIIAIITAVIGYLILHFLLSPLSSKSS